MLLLNNVLQLVKISVRTATEEGESANPQKLVVLNPRKCPFKETNKQYFIGQELVELLFILWFRNDNTSLSFF